MEGIDCELAINLKKFQRYTFVKHKNIEPLEILSPRKILIARERVEKMMVTLVRFGNSTTEIEYYIGKSTMLYRTGPMQTYTVRHCDFSVEYSEYCNVMPVMSSLHIQHHFFD